MSTSLTLFLVPGDFPDLDDLCDLDLDPESEPVGFVLVACFTFFSASSFSRRAAALCAALNSAPRRFSREHAISLNTSSQTPTRWSFTTSGV